MDVLFSAALLEADRGHPRRVPRPDQARRSADLPRRGLTRPAAATLQLSTNTRTRYSNVPRHDPFNAQSTAAEVIAGVDLTGKRAVVTGARPGLAGDRRALAAAGAR